MAAFAGLFGALAYWEWRAPRRPQAFARRVRWPSNLAIALMNGGLVRLLVPVSVVGMAALAQERHWGLLPMLALPDWLAAALALVLLDLAIYLQHVLFHAVPALWRLHRMHHADLDFDVTTGVRFHPLEILLSWAVKVVLLAALGPPVVVVLVFELLLNATSLFNHSNIRLPAGLDAVLRRFVVTPDMHRVHHSALPHETNSNFGFNFPWWDRLFGTYRSQPEAGHAGMTIGIAAFREAGELRLDRLLTQPFRDVT